MIKCLSEFIIFIILFNFNLFFAFPERINGVPMNTINITEYH